MYGGRVGIAGLACALVVLVGCSSTTGGQSQIASTSTVTSTTGHITTAPITTGRITTVPITTGHITTVPITTLPITTAPITTRLVTPITTGHITTTTAPPKSRTAVVSGMARRAGGTAVAHVLVGFRKATCTTCAPILATTGQNGAYRLSLPFDSYIVACVAEPYVCSISGTEDRSATVTIRADETLDLSVAAADVPTTPQPPTDTDPQPQPQPGNGYAIWGHVLTNEGAPVPHITIQLIPPRHIGQTIFADTVTDGSYGLAADSGVFSVVCITPNPDYECGPTGGDGDPYTVDIADGPQQVEFILCRSEDYPGCLSR